MMSRTTCIIFFLALSCCSSSAAFMGSSRVFWPRYNTPSNANAEALCSQVASDLDKSSDESITFEATKDASPSSYASVGRREAFSKLCLMAGSVSLLSFATPAEATTDSLWTPKKPTLDAEVATYSEEFVNFLTRFLITYDDFLRSFWISQANYIIVSPNSNATKEIARQRLDQFKSLEKSVEAGLQSRGGKFEERKGAELLLKDLLETYGNKGPLATKQLCGIFSLLSVDGQPTALIAQQLEKEDQLEEKKPGTMAAAPIPPIVLPADRKLIELPADLAPRRVGDDTIERFEAYASGIRFSRFRSIGKEAIPGPLVSRERTLDPSIIARFCAAGALASGGAHAALTPVDVLKTRLQTKPDKYSDGPIPAAVQIFEEEGAGAFASGFGPTAIGYFLGGSIAFGGTETLKRLSVFLLGPQFVLSNPFLSVLTCGAIAVSTCNLFVVPFEAARIRMVDDPSYASSLPEALARLAKEPGGLVGVYKSFPVLLIKEVPFHATKFAVFDVVSTSLKSSLYAVDVLSPLQITIASGMIAGVIAAVVSQPADATFTRCNQPREDGSKLSPVEAIKDLIDKGGLGFGLSSRCLFGAALVSLQFLAYDAAKNAFHVASSDLSVFLDIFAGLGT